MSDGFRLRAAEDGDNAGQQGGADRCRECQRKDRQHACPLDCQRPRARANPWRTFEPVEDILGRLIARDQSRR